MATTTISKGEQTRAGIMRAAEHDFAALGFEATRLELIGDAVGIRRPAIFYHFASKRELYGAVFSDIHESLIAATEARLDGAVQPWERLMLLVECWVDYMVARPTAARLLLRNCANADHPEEYLPAFSRNALQLIRAIIAEGIAVGCFASGMSMHLVNLLSGSILHYVCNPEQLGDERSYRPDDPAEVAEFKAVLRRTARALISPA